MPDQHVIANDHLSATIKAQGAELCSLRTANGQEWLWHAGPEWPKHAPVLFPIVGSLAGDMLRHQGREYRMGRHGFARDRRFAWQQTDAGACQLVLEDDAETRAQYPFAFRLTLGYALEGDRLVASTSVTNTGTEILPASCGAHPAFRWPLLPGMAKHSHWLRFDTAEPAPIRRIDKAGLMLAEALPTPVAGDTLTLEPALFDADAIIMDRLASRSLQYGAPGAPTIEVGWQGYEQLGIWSKPGADLLCIEPWYGFTSPAGWQGDFADKPGLMHLQPGETRSFRYFVNIG